MRPLRLLCASLALALCSGCQAAEVPESATAKAEAAQALEPTGWVTDQADLLSDVDEAALTVRLQDLKDRTGHELAVVTVRSLGGQAIEQYSLALARRWGVGRKDHHDGVVFLIAPNEREVRIEVARGINGVLTDDLSSSILAERVLPEFRAGKFAKGIASGIDGIIAVIGPMPSR